MKYYLWACKCGNEVSPLFRTCGKCGLSWKDVQRPDGTVPVVYYTDDGRSKLGTRTPKEGT